MMRMNKLFHNIKMQHAICIYHSLLADSVIWKYCSVSRPCTLENIYLTASQMRHYIKSLYLTAGTLNKTQGTLY